MARLYADENFPLPVVEELRTLGHDILTMQEDGKTNQSYRDAAVLATASAAQRAVLTANRKHFIQLHRVSSTHYGIIVCTFDPDFVGQARRIDQAIRSYDSLAGELIRVNKPIYGRMLHDVFQARLSSDYAPIPTITDVATQQLVDQAGRFVDRITRFLATSDEDESRDEEA